LSAGIAALSTWSHGRVPAFHVLSRPALIIYILTFAGPPGQFRAIQIGTKTALIAHRGINRILEYLVTAFADLILPAADFGQQVAVLRLAGSRTSKSGRPMFSTSSGFQLRGNRARELRDVSQCRTRLL
jgi:hypothetical protein